MCAPKQIIAKKRKRSFAIMAGCRPLPGTQARVRIHTPFRINEQIREQTKERIDLCCACEIEDERIEALCAEWDIERMVEAGAGAVTLAATALGLAGNRKWFLVSGAASAFLLMHALQGWCPALPALRRLGVRTADEIGGEKMALKLRRGDFCHVDEPDTEMLMQAIERN